MKSYEEVMEILEAFELTRSFRDAAELAGRSHHTVAEWVATRDRGELPVPGEVVVDLDVRVGVRADDDSTALVAAFLQHVLGRIVAIQTATTGVEKAATAIESVKHGIKSLTSGS